jgi:hypothetical protein
MVQGFDVGIEAWVKGWLQNGSTIEDDSAVQQPARLQ